MTVKVLDFQITTIKSSCICIIIQWVNTLLILPIEIARFHFAYIRAKKTIPATKWRSTSWRVNHTIRFQINSLSLRCRLAHPIMWKYFVFCHFRFLCLMQRILKNLHPLFVYLHPLFVYLHLPFVYIPLTALFHFLHSIHKTHKRGKPSSLCENKKHPYLWKLSDVDTQFSVHPYSTFETYTFDESKGLQGERVLKKHSRKIFSIGGPKAGEKSIEFRVMEPDSKVWPFEKGACFRQKLLTK